MCTDDRSGTDAERLCAGAGRDGAEKDGAQMLQEEYRALTGCAMTADVRCDRENEVENYTLQCDWNADGSARVEVLAPETLVGIAAEFNGTICRCTTMI